MITAPSSWRGWLVGSALILVLGVATLALAQAGGAATPAAASAPTPPVLEFAHQEVQPALLVQTLNDMSKQRWEIFQVIPAWTVNNDNGQAELVAKAYQVFARRPVAPAK